MTSSIAQTIIERYESRRPISKAMDSAAKQVLPGGDTRTTT